MTALETFTAHRERLFGIAYRMLGSVHDAEDLLQEAYIRWERAGGDTVENPRAFLCTMVTRMSIDALRSARRQRETYVGDWLPEPLSAEALPSETAALADSLSTAFLLLLERLSPSERAALLLRDVFGHAYPELAEVLGKNEANCRQLVRRARARARVPRGRFTPDPAEHARLLASFMTATRGGGPDVLMAFLAESATLRSDHGGKAAAARRTLHGARNIAKFFAGIMRRFVPEDFSTRITTINGAAGVIAYAGREPITAFTFDIEGGTITAIYVIRNPDKLRHLPPADAC